MNPKPTAKEQIQKILQIHGGETATKATNLLLKDPTLGDLRPMLEFISKNWQDPLRPAMIKLACESVNGKTQETQEVAVAMSLMNLSFYLWDDIIDKAPSRLFKPTMLGKFGEAPTLILGGLASAKAFIILNQTKLDQTKHEAISELFWEMWTKMATAETANLQARNEEYMAKDKLLKIENEASANLEICLKMGATLGNGSEEQITHLGKYGFCLGVILELQHDVKVSINLTLELADKIKTGAYTYALLSAKEKNPELQKNLQEITCAKTVESKELEKVVKGILATKALDEISERIEELSKQAIEELREIKKNSATRALQDFAEAQPRAFKQIM
jgi:geranylgeranyl pyrophosphate synthase